MNGHVISYTELTIAILAVVLSFTIIMMVLYYGVRYIKENFLKPKTSNISSDLYILKKEIDKDDLNDKDKEYLQQLLDKVEQARKQ